MLNTSEQRHAAVSTAVASVQSSFPSGLPELSDDDLPACRSLSPSPLWSYEKWATFRHSVMMIDDT
jgi:hypothetical protein